MVIGQSTAEKPKDDFLNNLDVYTKIFGAVIAAIGVVFGFPLTVITFKKTKAEIRKLELEANAIQQTGSIQNDTDLINNYVHIKDSTDVTVQITNDPRFLAPLLLLLDFIIAYIITSLLSYLLDIFVVDDLNLPILLIASLVLFIPILRESWRVRGVLNPKKEKPKNKQED